MMTANVTASSAAIDTTALESVSAVKDDDEIGNEIVIRSLRRMLFQAFQREDRDAAYLVYKATRQDWQAWLHQEQLEQQREMLEKQEHRLQQEMQEKQLEKQQQSQPQGKSSDKKQQTRQMLLRPRSRSVSASLALASKLKSSSSSKGGELQETPQLEQPESQQQPQPQEPQVAAAMQQQVAPLKLPSSSATFPTYTSSSTDTLGVLEQHMNPSDPFRLDDYRPLTDPYNTRKSKNNNTLKQQQSSSASASSSSTSAPARARALSQQQQQQQQQPPRRRSFWGARHNPNHDHPNSNRQQQQQQQQLDTSFSVSPNNAHTTTTQDDYNYDLEDLYEDDDQDDDDDNDDQHNILEQGNHHHHDHAAAAVAATTSTTTRPQRAAGGTQKKIQQQQQQQRITTPLHEAARMGHALLVQTMLRHPQVDPNVRNGLARTALHCVSGGWLQQEDDYYHDYFHHHHRNHHNNNLHQNNHHDNKNGHNKNNNGIGTLSSPTTTTNPSNSNSTTTTIMGIRAPEPILPIVAQQQDTRRSNNNNPSNNRSGSAAAAAASKALLRTLMGRFFPTTTTTANNNNSNNSNKNSDTTTGTTTSNPNNNTRVANDAGKHRQGVMSEQEAQQLAMERIDTALSLLSWCPKTSTTTTMEEQDIFLFHNDKSSSTSSSSSFQNNNNNNRQAPCTNSVDAFGRTALHYAAELGRSEICMAIASSFGTMLTIVDDAGKTPCELAAASAAGALAQVPQEGKNNHHKNKDETTTTAAATTTTTAEKDMGDNSNNQFANLAAQLEARALLYVDPDGMNDELLAAVLQNQQQRHFNATTATSNNSRGSASGSGGSSDGHGDTARPSRSHLVPPFSWFETWDRNAVQKEREYRIQQATEKIHKIIQIEIDDQALYESIISSSSDEEEEVEEQQRGNVNFESGSVSKTPSELVGGDDDDDDDDDERLNVKPPAINKTSSTLSSTSPSVSSLALSPGEVSTDPLDITVQRCDADYKVDKSGTADSSTSETSAKNDVDNHDRDGKDPMRTKQNHQHYPKNKISTKKTDDLTVFQRLHQSHVQLYLAAHQWDVQKALMAFVDDPFAAFEEARVPLPTAVQSTPAAAAAAAATAAAGETVQDPSVATLSKEEDLECLICCDEFDAENSLTTWKTLDTCGHAFCKSCLGDYIADCAKSKSGLCISCPHHECTELLSPNDIVTLTPTVDIYERLVQAENENFCATAGDLRFCPHPSCSGVVKFHAPLYVKHTVGLDESLLHIVGAVCTATESSPQQLGNSSSTNSSRLHNNCNSNKFYQSQRLTYEGVNDPNCTNSKSTEPVIKAHRFCFSCGEPFLHWPVPCHRLTQWKNVVAEHIQEVQDGSEAKGEANYHDVAQKLWLKTNTRPCPKCKAPIEKNEGCNHMICSNPHCKFEFCWICRNDWKLHNTQTGGFFRCNRWVDQKEHEFYDTPPEDPEGTAIQLMEDITNPSTMAVTYGTAMHATRVAKKRSREMARFLHHYQRWSAHAESAALERKMSDSARTRLAPVVVAAVEFDGRQSFNFGGEGLSFVHDAFTELLECRSMLQHSYAHSYFRYNFYDMKTFRILKKRMTEKMALEQLQSELEMLTEQLSDVVARAHIRAAQSQIKYMTALVAEKRKEFSNLMISIHMAELKELNEEREQKELAHGSKESTSRSSIKKHLSKQRRINRRRDNLAGLLDEINGTTAATAMSSSQQRHERAAAAGTATTAPLLTAATRNDTVSTRPASQGDLMMDVETDDDEMEEAIRTSLEEFLASTSSSLSAMNQENAITADDNVDDDDDDDDDEESGRIVGNFHLEYETNDWACTACTYVNDGGRRCAMCGTARAAN